MKQKSSSAARWPLWGMSLGAATGAVYNVAWVFVMSLTGWGKNLIWGGITPDLSLPAALIGATLGSVGGLCAGGLATVLAKHTGAGLVFVAWGVGGAAGGFIAANIVRVQPSLGWLATCGPPVLVGAIAGCVFGFWVQRRDAYWYS
jgi:hypothetical protein